MRSAVAAIVAEDGTEGSCQRVVESQLDRRGGRAVTKHSTLRPVRPYVSYMTGGDMKLVTVGRACGWRSINASTRAQVLDPVLRKQGARTWRVNGMVTGEELKVSPPTPCSPVAIAHLCGIVSERASGRGSAPATLHARQVAARAHGRGVAQTFAARFVCQG